MKTLKKALCLPLLLSLTVVGALPGMEPEPEMFSQGELDQMLAPVALYPDVLLSQVLMAATYPLEVVEAARWSRAHPDLEGEAAVDAVQDEDWDDSVKALVGFPDLIQLMDDNLRWTRRLGDAFLLQEQDVLETTQLLRQKAFDEGTLDELAEVRVEKRDEVIIIEPADVQVVYVPYYSPRVVYGNWWWYDHPPYYWGPPYGYTSSLGFYWSRGFHVSTSFYYCNFDWRHRNIVVVKPTRGHSHRDYRSVLRNPRYGSDSYRWRHDPRHRRGVTYASSALRRDYGRSSASGITRAPMPTRAETRTARTERTERPVRAETRSPRTERSERPVRAETRSPRRGRTEQVTRGSSGDRRTPPAARPPVVNRPERPAARPPAQPSRPTPPPQPAPPPTRQLGTPSTSNSTAASSTRWSAPRSRPPSGDSAATRHTRPGRTAEP